MGDAPKRPRTRAWGKIAGVGALAVTLLVIVTMTPLGNEAFKGEAVETTAGCPLAVEALGGKPTQRFWGWQPGSTHKSGAFRFIETSVPLGGPKAEGSLSLTALRRQGEGRPWILRDIVLEVGGERIDIRHCGLVSRLPLLQPKTFRGEVSRVTGPSPIEKGESCEVTVASARTIYPCSATLRCDGKPLLDEIFVPCAHVVTGPTTSALVGKTTDLPDGDAVPRIDLDERRRSAELRAHDEAWSFAIEW